MIKNDKLRIVLIGQVFPWKGGISHYNSLLANELLARADLKAISFVRVFPAWLHPLKSRLDTESQNFFKGKAETLFDIPNPFTWRRVVRAALAHEPDVLIFHWYTPLLAVPLWFVISRVKRARPQCRVIAICHNAVPHERTPFDAFLSRLVWRKVDALVVHSARDVENVKQWLPGVHVIRLFHPVYDFFYEKLEGSEARKQLGISESAKVLLFFGGIRAYKGLEYLLRALPIARERIPGLCLVIAGEFFGNRDRYTALIKSLKLADAIRLFDRYIPNKQVSVFFSAADAVVAPYVSGTQSGSLNIALAFRKPMIATDVGGFGELAVTGKTGYLVPPRDSNAIARAIVLFYTEGPASRFYSGIEAVKRDHSWETFAKQLLIAAAGAEGSRRSAI